MRRLAAACWLLVAAVAEAQSAAELYQRGLMQERAGGRIDSAITLYLQAVARSGSNRALAARALIRLGSAYEALGRGEARAAYERVIRDFADQPVLVEQARQRIAALDAVPDIRGPATNAPVARVVWSGDNVNLFAVPSPDRRYSTYRDPASGNLGVHDLITGTDRVLTTTARLRGKTLDTYEAYHNERTVFSQDSRQIAYAWHEGKSTEWQWEMRTINVRGGEPRLVAMPKMKYVQLFTWTPRADGLLAAVQDSANNQYLGIVRLTGQIERIKSVPLREVTWASLSPDGRWIAYDRSAGTGREHDIFIIASDGTREGALVVRSGNDWHPMWSPDGSAVVFYSDRFGSRRVWQVEVADGVARGEPVVLTQDMGRTQPIGFTPDGAFWYGPAGEALGIFVQVIAIDSISGRVTEPAADISHPAAGSSLAPDWSPDGQSIVTLYARDDFASQFPTGLMILNRAAATWRELSVPLRQYYWPRWAPDGRSILLLGEQVDGRTGLFRVDAETGALSVIHFTSSLLGELRRYPPPVEWSSDGRKIYYAIPNDSTKVAELHRYDIDVNRDTVFYRDTSARLIQTLSPPSPDGRWMALTVTGGKTFDADYLLGRHMSQLLSLQDGTVRDLSPPHPFAQFNWMPDSRALLCVFFATQGGDTELWRVPIDGPGAQKIDLGVGRLTYLRIDRSGRHLAFALPAPSVVRQLWVMQNMLPRKPTPR